MADHRAITSDYFRNMIASMLEFFETGKLMAPHDETLEVMAILEAGAKALKQRDEWVSISR